MRTNRFVPRDPLFAAHAEETSKLRDTPDSKQAPCVHLVVGPVGAGKSTFARGLSRERGAARLTLDEWMTTLFRPDRPENGIIEWYVERAARCVEQIWSVATAITDTGRDVVLEIGLLERAQRQRVYRRVAEAGLGLTVYALDAPRELRRERVMERNRSQGETFSMVVPPDVFERASDRWEPLGPEECEGRDVRFVRTDG